MTQSPFHALSDHRGKLTIEGLPAGKVTLTLWHERAVRLRDLHPVVPPRKVEVEIAAGKTTDLGRIVLSPR